MKTLKTFSVLFLLSLLTLASCKKDDDNKGGSTSSAVVNGEKITACEGCIGIVRSDDVLSINFSGTLGLGKAIAIGMPRIPEVGNHNLFGDSGYLGYYSDGKSTYTSSNSGLGTIQIEEVKFDSDNDLEMIKATFSFTGKNSSDETVEVTEGILVY